MSSQPSPQAPPSHLTPSPLGTKEYWQATYTSGLTTHTTNPSHTGTSWFSDSLASEKILAYLLSLTSAPSSTSVQRSGDELEGHYDNESQTAYEHDSESPYHNQKEKPKLNIHATTFLDLGCGNGELLFLLREKGGFGGGTGMLGLDYSPASVDLARRIAVGRNLAPSVRFEVWDVMAQEPGAWLPSSNSNSKSKSGVKSGGEGGKGFDIVLDKGTFDAISLSSDLDESGRRVFETYPAKVLPLVRRGGLLIVTSCNWTEGELEGWFVGRGGGGGGEVEEGFEKYGRIEYPRFRFGGMEGQSVSSVVFRRK